ncbi:hypothetical protein OG21DRAFT_1300137 [Imleria badia]|nr:hypothetical protein OG21DRAFT_1300137 [Imleria badia]
MTMNLGFVMGDRGLAVARTRHATPTRPFTPHAQRQAYCRTLSMLSPVICGRTMTSCLCARSVSFRTIQGFDRHEYVLAPPSESTCLYIRSDLQWCITRSPCCFLTGHSFLPFAFFTSPWPPLSHHPSSPSLASPLRERRQVALFLISISYRDRNRVYHCNCELVLVFDDEEVKDQEHSPPHGRIIRRLGGRRRWLALAAHL